MRTRLITLALLLAALVAAPAAALAQAQALYELASSLGGAQAAVAISTNTTTQIIAAPSGTSPGGGTQAIYVMGHEVMAAGTGNIQFVYGTGVNCATGQQAITGAYTLTAQARTEHGGGFGPEWVLPPGNALCAVTSAAVGMNGFVSYRVK
jgi:hypothetical protein